MWWWWWGRWTQSRDRHNCLHTTHFKITPINTNSQRPQQIPMTSRNSQRPLPATFYMNSASPFFQSQRDVNNCCHKHRRKYTQTYASTYTGQVSFSFHLSYLLTILWLGHDRRHLLKLPSSRIEPQTTRLRDYYLTPRAHILLGLLPGQQIFLHHLLLLHPTVST